MVPISFSVRQGIILKKPAPHLTLGGYRASKKVMLRQEVVSR
jgi:hypothetical protein